MIAKGVCRYFSSEENDAREESGEIKNFRHVTNEASERKRKEMEKTARARTGKLLYRLSADSIHTRLIAGESPGAPAT